MVNKLDFLIIGAQKSGTTTLFKLLSEHPGVYMPPGKEAPFFTKDDLYSQGIDKYIDDFFSSASPGLLWGTATPHYLSDPRACERIANTLPNVKLIAILREPADRALSHYRMSARRGLESRSFEHAVNEMLDPVKLDMSRKLHAGESSETKTYIAWGEYGRQISKYLKFFDKDQILILFTSELEKSPEMIVKKILTFLELPEFSFSLLGKRFHEGGEKEWIPFLKKLKKINLIRKVWRFFPPRLRSKVMYGVNQLNIVKSSDDLTNYDDEAINQLKAHYISDIDKLEEAIGCTTPWNDQGKGFPHDKLQK